MMNKRNILWVILIAMTLSTSLTLAATAGRVMDQNGEPVVGVTVHAVVLDDMSTTRNSNTVLTTTTDADGEYFFDTTADRFFEY